MEQKTKLMALGALATAAFATVMLAGPPAAPQVSVDDVNPGTTIERNLCLTIALPAGASECGDLRLAHMLPSVRTLNQVRAPVLMYNSQHASPRPVVAVNVSLPDGAGGLSRVVATLKVNGTPRGQGVWRGSGWPAGTGPVRIAVAYDAGGDPTGPYRYTLEVKACYGSDCVASTASGQLAVVNRRDSPFGAGWWLAGVEHLVLDPFGKPVLWVAGDGSTRRYTAARGDSVWGAPTVDQPDTLKREGEGWVRLLPGGGRVRFDALGRHVATSNRLGHVTEFWYNSAGGIDSIGVPPTITMESDLAPKRLVPPYHFVYGTEGRLSRVEAPDGGGGRRITTLHHNGPRVDSITDPDETRVRFGYADATSFRVASHVDRGKHRTDFRYDTGFRLAGSKLWMDTLVSSDSIVTRIRAAETLGLTSATGTGAVPAAEAYAEIDGPRLDADALDRTRLWLDRWGAPQRIVNALSDTMELTRGDPRFPALVTRVRHPNGRVLSARYDARGNLAESIDSSTWHTQTDGSRRYATTSYEWDQRWDAVTKITFPEGEVTTFGYDAATGNRIWQQVGTDMVRRVTFTYETDGATQGMISTSTAPGTQNDSVAYDRLGNLALVVSPGGSRVEYHRDALGRDSVTIAPLEGSLSQRQTVSYVPGTDLVERTRSYGPAMNGRGAQTLWVRSEYDVTGNVTAVERWSDPDLPNDPIGRIRTSWRYDAAGRVVAELAPGSGTFTRTVSDRVCEGSTFDGCVDVPRETTYTVEYKDSTVYDPAGNPVEVHTRRKNPATGAALVIRMKYDVLGQLEERVIPEVHYSQPRDQGIPLHYRWARTAHCTGEMLDRTYPGRPNDGGCGYRIDQDVQTFRYDDMGNVIRADNRDAQVRRRFNINGTLWTDSLRIRTVEGADFTQHEYGLEFRYDLNGRRIELNHPSQLAPSASQGAVSYGYHPATGALDHVTDPLGNKFRFEYDARGSLRRKITVDAGFDEYDFNDDGALTNHRTFRYSLARGNTPRIALPVRNTELAHDTQGRVTEANSVADRRDTVTSEYSGLGHVVRTTAAIYGDTTNTPTFRGDESFAYDAFGNVANDTTSQSRKHGAYRLDSDSDRASEYVAGTGRLSSSAQKLTQYAPLFNIPVTTSRRESFRYDASGNLDFSTQNYRSNGSCSSEDKVDADCEDRVSFYAADGTLRAAEHRVRMGENNGNYWRDTFEEYRYDALGRRVWVRSRMVCPGGIPKGWPRVACFSSVRRTVWDGDAELWEIQMPGEDGSVYLESDTASIPVREYINWYPVEGGETQSWDGTKYSPSDPNPLHGRVAYTHGLGIDQPLSIVRIGLNRYYTPALNYNNSSPSDTSVKSVAFAPFAAFPQSDWRGHVDGATYAGGAKQHCETFSGTERCTSVVMSQTWSAYGHEDPSAVEWHGTLLTGKRDATGTMYRRARYYDPQTGRFTQEDPIGLAGGVNLYGYAAGDPINLSDPSGLCPWCIGAVAGAIVGAGVYHLSTPAGQRTAWGYLGYAAGGAAIGGTLGYAASALLPAAAPTTGTAVQIGEVTQLTRGIVSLDTNALIAAIEGTPAAQAAVQQALAGRVPALSRTVIREFMRKGNAEALRKYMFENGVVVIADGSPSVVQGLVAQGLKLADAKVVAAAIGRGVGVLTRDARLLRRMIPGVWQF